MRLEISFCKTLYNVVLFVILFFQLLIIFFKYMIQAFRIYSGPRVSLQKLHILCLKGKDRLEMKNKVQGWILLES